MSAARPMEVGWIGLGAMGMHMAGHLIGAGHRLHLFARRPEQARPLVERGAQLWGSPADVAARAQVLFTIVTTTDDVRQVLFGASGVAQALKPDSVVVDMGTISPAATVEFAAELRRHGIEMLDAPVSGGEKGARDAALAIMVGGRADIVERVMPLFRALGRTVVHVGDNGAGQITKACNQLVIAVTQQAVAEATLLARASGVDPARVHQAIMGGSAWSRILEMQGDRMVRRDFVAGIEARLHAKDANIAVETGKELGLALPGAALAAQTFNALMGAGGGRRDSAAVLEIVEALSGRGVAPE